MTAGSRAAEGFGGVLRRLRLAAGLSQETLAERAKLSVETIGALERGVRLSPYRTTVDLLADGLGLKGDTRAALAGAARSRARCAAGGAPAGKDC